MPLMEEIETIDPGRPCDVSSAATAWLMKNIVSRFWVNSARQSARVTRVERIQVEGAAAYDVHEAVQVAGGPADLLHHERDAVVGGGVGRDRHDREALRRQRRDMLLEVLRRAAHRDDGRPGTGDHARHRGADAPARRTADDDDASVEAQEVLRHGAVPPVSRRASTLPSASAET
nr:hypothetical protein [Streptomyces sp. S1D4-11]